MEVNSLLIKDVKVLDSKSEYNLQSIDILIEEGVIKKIANSIQEDKNIPTLKEDNLFISQGWIDLKANFQDPGNEQKEDLNSGARAAMAGGFVAVSLSPETNPPVKNKSEVEYLRAKSESLFIDIYPQACILKDAEKGILTEMQDLANSGGVKIFSSGSYSISNDALLSRSLDYASNMDTVMFYAVQNKELTGKGQMHEGLEHVKVGLKGIPSMVEYVEIEKLINFSYYNKKHVHISGLSTREGVELIRKAKTNKQNVTADTSIHQLCFTDKDLLQFDTNFKLHVPLRSEEDRQALIEGIADGTIDLVVSNHEPHEQDRKLCEFELASPGAISLQTFLPAFLKHVGKDYLESLIDCLTYKPAKLLDREITPIAVGEKASLTIFSTSKKWVLNENSNLSKSKNSPLWGIPLEGKALALVNNNRIIIN